MNRFRLSRDALLAAGLVILLGVLTVAAALRESRPEETIPLDSASTAPDGAAALFEWLEAIGYSPHSDVGGTFQIPEDAGLILVLEPAAMSDFTPEELDRLDAWVQDGGTLMYAGQGFAAGALPDHFGFHVRYMTDPVAQSAPIAPLLTGPVQADPVPLKAIAYLESDAADYLPLVALPNGPVVVATDHGAGRVILSAATHPFTNAGLKDAGSAEFVLNLIGAEPPGTVVWFDEWHHGRRGLANLAGGPAEWLRSTPAGRAVLFSVLAVFLWLVVTGRAFGPPLPAHREAARRAPTEYIDAIAALNMRAGNRRHLLDHYRRQLKRSLAHRYPVDPALPDERFLHELSHSAPELDIEHLQRLLADLNRRDVSEAEMVRIVGEAAKL